MIKLIILFSLILSGCQYEAASKLSIGEQFIVGGELVSKNELSSVVALVKAGDFHCSGVLIAPQIVLTAAHCLVDVQIESLSVYVGNGYNKPADRTFVRGQYEISKMLIHPKLVHVEGLGLRNLGEYNANDVGLVFLEKSILNVTPSKVLTDLHILRQKLYTKVETTVVGFGYTAEEDVTNASFKKPDYGLKRKVNIPIVSFDNHEVDIRGEGVDSCYIDSGGPVFVEHEGERFVLALVSGSNGFCAENHFPVYYSLVFDSICWIASETGLEFEDIANNCDRNQNIINKCDDLPPHLASVCAKDMSDLIFSTQY